MYEMESFGKFVSKQCIVKVLRVTSFTRKDLGPSLVPVPERRKRFPHQNENQSLQPPKISHSR